MAKGSSIKDVHKILAKIDLPLSLVPCFCLHWPNPFALPLRTSAPRLECKMLAVYCLPSLPVAIRPAIVATGNASAVIEGEGNLLSLICRLSQCWWPRTASDRAGGGGWYNWCQSAMACPVADTGCCELPMHTPSSDAYMCKCGCPPSLKPPSPFVHFCPHEAWPPSALSVDVLYGWPKTRWKQ